MVKKILWVFAVASLLCVRSASAASILIEDFEAPFPAWESGWLAVNSNLQNYYGVGAARGNNPDGLWVADDSASGAGSFITFDSPFALTLSSFDIDIAGYVSGT